MSTMGEGPRAGHARTGRTGRPPPQPFEPPSSFAWGRWLVSGVTGAIGMVCGLFMGHRMGLIIDGQGSNPLGASDGFLRVGFVTMVGVALGSLIGTALGARMGHYFGDGAGGFWLALGATLVGAVACVIVSMVATAISLPALLLLPLAAATGLELAMREE